MNKTEKVSIGKFAFTFDESAFEIVNNYINDLEKFYLPQDGGSEIMEGIEERISELLRERFSTDNVISQNDIEEIINIIGKPEAIEEESGSSEIKQHNKSSAKDDSHRRLYRDLSNKMIGGVCSGLASYFNIDILLVRIITLVLCTPILIFGHNFPFIISIPIIYIILWICITPAKTAKQRWEMRGETGSLNDIRKNIEAGANEMGDVQKVGTSDAVKALGRALSLIVGLILLLITLGGLGFLCLLVFGIEDVYYFDDSLRSMHTFLDGFPIRYGHCLIILIMIIVLTPLILLIYGSVLLIFNLRSPKFKPGLILFILWLLSIIAMCVSIFCYFSIDNSNGNITITETITRTYDTLDIDSNGNMIITETITRTYDTLDINSNSIDNSNGNMTITETITRTYSDTLYIDSN